MYRFLTYALAIFLVLAAGAYLMNIPHRTALVAGYMLSFAFVGSTFLVIDKAKSWKERKFYRFFFISLALRFALVLVVFTLVLKTIKIHQIYFTVSFIFSYILHSVIEIISINKIFESDN